MSDLATYKTQFSRQLQVNFFRSLRAPVAAADVFVHIADKEHPIQRRVPGNVGKRFQFTRADKGHILSHIHYLLEAIGLWSVEISVRLNLEIL